MTRHSNLRSWVDDCPTGILADCFQENPPIKVLTQTEAAFQNYDKMLNQTTIENFVGFRRNLNRNLRMIIFLLMLIYFFLILA